MTLVPSSVRWQELVAFAVIVGDASPTYLARLAGATIADTARALETAAAQGLIVDGQIDEPAAERLMADLGTGAVAHLHATVARQLLVEGWSNLDQVVDHVRAAGMHMPIPDLIDRLDHAARSALTTSDYRTAEVLLELAEEFGTADDHGRRAWRLSRLAHALEGLGRVDEGRDVAARAFDLAEASGDVNTCLDVAVLSAFPADWYAGDRRTSAILQRFEALRPTDEQAVAALGARAIAEMRIPVRVADGQQLAWVSRASVAQPLADEALERSRGRQATTRLVATLAWRACHRAPRHLARRLTTSSEAVDLGQRLGLPARLVEAASLMAVDAIEAADPGLYERAVSVARWVSERDGNPRLLAHTRAIEAGAAFRQLDLERGRRLHDEAFEIARSVPLSSALSLNFTLLANYFVVIDDPPLPDLIVADDHPIMAHPLTQAATALGWARNGERERSLGLIRRSLQSVDEESSMLLQLSLIAEAATLIDAPAEIDRLITLLEPWADHIAVDANAWWPANPISASLAELHAAIGHHVQAQHAARSAVRAASEIGDQRTLRRMAALTEELARHPDVTSPAVPDPLAGLTSRQHRVMAMVADGAINRDIARRLSISESTVKADLAVIRRRLNLTSRTQIGRYLAQLERQPAARPSETPRHPE